MSKDRKSLGAVARMYGINRSQLANRCAVQYFPHPATLGQTFRPQPVPAPGLIVRQTQPHPLAPDDLDHDEPLIFIVKVWIDSEQGPSPLLNEERVRDVRFPFDP